MELKKTIIMSPIDIMPMFISMPDMEASAVEEAIMLPEVMVMDMPDMSLIPDMAVDVGMLMLDMPLMSISTSIRGERQVPIASRCEMAATLSAESLVQMQSSSRCRYLFEPKAMLRQIVDRKTRLEGSDPDRQLM